MATIFTVNHKRHTPIVTFIVVIPKNLTWSVLFKSIFERVGEFQDYFKIYFVPTFKSVILELL